MTLLARAHGVGCCGDVSRPNERQPGSLAGVAKEHQPEQAQPKQARQPWRAEAGATRGRGLCRVIGNLRACGPCVFWMRDEGEDDGGRREELAVFVRWVFWGV